jgi:type I restriction enzyme R subunit
MKKEAKARIRINRLLEHAGWRFFDDEKGPANIALEANVKIKKKVIDQFGDDFEKTADFMFELTKEENQSLNSMSLT